MGFINDGHPTTIEFDVASGVTLSSYFREKSVTPPSITGGGENDTTTMRNSTWRTKQPKKLKSMGNCTFTASYDPAVLDVIVDELINVNGLITFTFPDGSTWDVYGWLDEFTPGECVEGSQPEATCTIICSNETTNNVETAPDYTAAA
jgi:hypothetical protein